MKNLPDNRCPECGREFDPRDPHSYMADRASARRLLRPLACMWIAVATTFASMFITLVFMSLFKTDQHRANLVPALVYSLGAALAAIPIALSATALVMKCRKSDI